MLRLFVLLLVLGNAVFLAWTQGWLDDVTGVRASGDREPERSARWVEATQEDRKLVQPWIIKISERQTAIGQFGDRGLAPAARSANGSRLMIRLAERRSAPHLLWP